MSNQITRHILAHMPYFRRPGHILGWMKVSVYTKDSLELRHNFEDSWKPFRIKFVRRIEFVRTGTRTTRTLKPLPVLLLHFFWRNHSEERVLYTGIYDGLYNIVIQELYVPLYDTNILVVYNRVIRKLCYTHCMITELFPIYVIHSVW